MNNNFSKSANHKNLLQLILLRIIAIIGQVATIIFVSIFFEISLPIKPMFGVVLLLFLINCISFYCYKTRQNISDKFLFIELLFDVSALTAQLYLSGGASNPFISLFLLQVIIAAILLRTSYAWTITAITTFCYIWLGFNFNEMHEFHNHNAFNLHLHGMLISHILATVLLLIFVTKISKNLKERDQKTLEEKQLLRSAMLATAAAHDLGTPLATISVILNDWKNLDLKKEDLNSDILMIESQIERCKKTLSEILSDSGSERLEQAKKSDFK